MLILCQLLLGLLEYELLLEYDRIDISEGINIKKCKETSRECSLCKFYYFLDKNFNYGQYLCDGCYDMSMKAVSMKKLTIINHNGNHYRVNFAFMNKKDAYGLVKNAVIMGEKGTLKKINFLSVDTIKMSLKKINFGDKEVDKKKFYSSKEAILLDSVDLSKIVVSSRCKINDTTYKSFCGYLNNNSIKPLCIILPQVDEYIKYFDDGEKNMSFITDDEKIYEKYNKIWEVIRKLLKVNFAVSPVRDDKYLVAKLKIFAGINRTTFINNSIPIEKKSLHLHSSNRY